MRNIICLALIVCIIASCSSTKSTSNTLSHEQIRFGYGGGFTGAVTSYCITNSGKSFKKQNFDISKIRASTAGIEDCFEQCQAIGFGQIEMNSPGNTYSFIEHKVGDQLHRVTWNPHQPGLPSDLIVFNNMLLELVGEEPIVYDFDKKESSNTIQPVGALHKKVVKKAPAKKKILVDKKKLKLKQHKQ